MPPTATRSDRAAFLEALRAADILTAGQQAKVKSSASTGSAADLATALVSAGLLTRFQADHLLAGRADGLVLGQHIILEQIGHGTMSRVYKAKHRTMGRPVAVKVLSSELTRTAADRQNFQREIRAAGKLTHPNIVTAYDANELHDRFYLLLEFVDGPNLDSFVRQRGPLSVGEACEFIRQVAAGLQHAHEKGMCHRDIKPANLLVARPTPSAALMVKIADFGIPKSSTCAAEYGAPEQLGVRVPDAPPVPPADHRADLYSLGCVFYFLLAGRPPFAGGTPEDKARRHLWEEAPPLFQLRPDVPPDVAAIVHRLLAKHPAARFASAAELLAHLDATYVPAAIPLEGGVCFDVSAQVVLPGYDSGFLTNHETPGLGTYTPPQPGVFEFAPQSDASPWSQLTDEVMNDGDTVSQEANDTPHTPSPRKSSRPNPIAGVPTWMIAVLLLVAALVCLLCVGIVIKFLPK